MDSGGGGVSKFTTECGICGEEAILVAEFREAYWGNEKAIISDEFYRCEGCGTELYEPGQMDASIVKAKAAIGKRA